MRFFVCITQLTILFPSESRTIYVRVLRLTCLRRCIDQLPGLVGIITVSYAAAVQLT